MRAIRDFAGLFVVVGLLVVPSAASAFAPRSGRWNGSIDGYKEPLHFNVGHGAVLKFTVPKLGCTSDTGYQVETFYVPRASIKQRSFDGKFHPSKGVTVEVKGSFTSTNAAKGVVKELQPCNPGGAAWHANLGHFKPPHIKQQVPICPTSGCLASDGMFIKVTATDRTIKSIDDPTNIYDTSADPFLANGGVGVSVLGSDRSDHDPVTLYPGADFQLRLGSGDVVKPDQPLSTVVTQSGASYSCGDSTFQRQLTQGASYGPVSVCYDAANASDRQHLMLYYMPDGFDILAKIPLG